MTETQKNPLAESFNALSLIRFAFPSMVMMLFMGLYTIVDTIFVARFVDTNALASINIVCPVINLIVGLGTMLATGGSAVVAKKMGNGNTEEARSNFTLIVVAGAVIGLLITAIGLLFLDEIIWGLGASEILFPYCKDYLTIQLIFTAFNMLQVLYQNLFVTAGKPTLGLVLAVLAAITVLIYSQFLLTTLYIGFSMGTAPVVSYNYGSGNVKQLKKTVRICFSFIAGISIFVFLFSLFSGESIAKVFAENNRNVFEITKSGFSIFSFSFLFSGCNIFSSALFTAVSNGKASAAISFLRTFGFITVFLLALPKFLKVTGVWLAVPLAELFTLMLTVYLICRHRKQYHYF